MRTQLAMLCVFASLSAPVGAQAPAQKKTKAASQPCQLVSENPPDFDWFKFIPKHLDFTKLNRFPTVSYVVNEDGAVTNVKIMKSTGSAKVDTGLIKSVQSWKYKPQPGCTVETSMAVVIDIGQE